MPFRIQGRHLFLTYPQCHLTNEAIYNHLIDLPVGNEKPTKIVVAKELHEDGHPHFHAYLCFDKRRDLRYQRHFDISGYHPNIQVCRSVKDVLKYVTKDGEYMSNFTVIKPTIHQLIERADDETSFALSALEHYDKNFANCFNSWMSLYKMLKSKKKVCDPVSDWTLMKMDDLHLLARILSITAHEKNGSRTKSIWLFGPSKTGKSTLARSIGKHAYMQNTWCVDELSDDAQYLVLDDIAWDTWKWQYKSVLGCQKDVIFTGKYARPRRFNFNMPCIVCSNEKPVFSVDELNWLDVNIDFFEINNKLY